MENNNLLKFANLIIKKGVNIQQDQELFISCPIECADFGRALAKEAFEAGAIDVTMNWNDEKSSKIRYDYGKLEIFESLPQYIVDRQMHYLDKKAAFLSVYAESPDLLKDVSEVKLSTFARTKNKALKKWSDAVSSNKVSWSVVSVPTVAWAKKVFPCDSEEVATNKLWDLIYKSTRVDMDDPVLEWDKHVSIIKNKCKYLNDLQLKELRYTNSIGTNITIGLPKNHIWLGASEKNVDGIEFIANLPTEEMFTAPDKNKINGTVVSSKPFCYNGNIIEDFSLTYDNGKLIKYSAKKGEEILKCLLDMDKDSNTFGEVAIVPFDSPISNMNILFYNTLFDENASCHFALGRAYQTCIDGAASKTEEELDAMGINISMVHEDFMIGTADLSIIGIEESGNEIHLFANGNWVD